MHHWKCCEKGDAPSVEGRLYSSYKPQFTSGSDWLSKRSELLQYAKCEGCVHYQTLATKHAESLSEATLLWAGMAMQDLQHLQTPAAQPMLSTWD